MLSDEPIDEDLEALLYAQVYYGKEQEVELPNLLESKPTEPEKKIEDQGGATSEDTSSRRHFSQKKRYYENNLVQEDKEKENTDSLAKEINTETITKQNLSIENPVLHSTAESEAESNITPEILEKPQDQILLPQKEQELDSTFNQQVIKISTSSPSTNPLTKDSSTQFVTTVSTPSESGHPQLLNNIIINQYLFPPSFQERLKSSLENTPISKKCKSDLKKLKVGRISEQDFFNNLRRRLRIQRKQQSNIRKAYLKKQQSIAQSEVIYLSDSDSSDIEIIEATNSCDSNKTRSPTMKEKVEVLLEESEDEGPEDDEIIYVAPPPVPVISIDTESESDNEEVTSEHVTASTQTPNKAKSSQTLSQSQQDIDETSDDFLQPKNTPDNFNFSLHGSDFQNAEFVRPLNPTDLYETESSTSTSDFNRDSSRQFCNSVKTIVFSEVEFPNQDIFNENNLETFGEFITPRRADKEKGTEAPSSSVDKPSTSKGNKRVNPRTSSESSSESEYDGSTAYQNLPDLSPMVCAESSPKKSKGSKKNLNKPPKKKKGQIEEQRDYNTRSSKKVKDKFVDHGIIDNTELPVTKEPTTRKAKRKSLAALEEEEEEIPKKKSKKKKNKSGNKSAEDNEDISEASNSASDRSTSPRKILKDNCQVTSSTPSKKKGTEDTDALDKSSGKKTKRKKKQTKNSDLGVAVLEQEVLTVEEQVTTEDSGKKKGRKKKTKELSSIKSSDDQVIQDVLEETNQAKEQGNDSSKKKNKKRKQKASSESRAVSEASSTTNVENQSTTRTEKEQNDNLHRSSNKQLILIEESNVLEQTDTSESNISKKKNKKKKRISTDKSVEESNISEVENENTKDQGKEKSTDKPLEEEEHVEKEISSENVIERPLNPEEDVILIEKVIPIHTIDSSESEEEDILTFEDVGNDLELANISLTKEKQSGVIENREFDVDYVQSKMSDDPEKWKILPTDRYSQSITKRGPRCNKCRHFGHISISCPNKPAEPICTLCGEPGHQEPRCPNKVCFTCGKPGNFTTVYCYMCARQRQLTCSLCFCEGHKTEYCPDLWRRYFLTTTEGPLTVPKKNRPTLKPRNKQWCSGCASNGHLEFQCNTYKWMREYPVSSPQIFKYRDVYAGQRQEKLQTPPRPDPSQPNKARSQYEKLQTPPRPEPSQPNRARSQYDKLVTSLQSTSRHGIVSKCLNILNKNLRENDSQEKIAGTAENQGVIEKLPESLNDTSEKQGDVVESRPTAESASEDPLIPETNPGAFIPTTDQLTQSPSYNQSDQIQFVSPSGQRDRSKQKRNSPKHTKINPVSVLRPSGYTPYHSVLNPYSVLGAPSSKPPRGLFNQVPEDMLAKQLADLASTVPDCQNLDQLNFNQNSNLHEQRDMYYYGSQIPIHPSPLFRTTPNAYQSFSPGFAESHPPESYHDIQEPYRERDYLDRPHTITRDPMEDGERIDTQSPYYRLEERQPFIEDRERQIPQNTNTTSNTDQGVVESNIPQLTEEVQKTETTWGNRDGSPIENRDKFSVQQNDYQPYIEEQKEFIEARKPLRDDVKNDSTQTIKCFDSYIPSGITILQFSERKTICIEGNIIKNFLYFSPTDLREMLCKEIDKLESLRGNDPFIYHQYLAAIARLKENRGSPRYLEHQTHSLYQQINMFFFGVNTLRDGLEHMNSMKSLCTSAARRIKQSRRWNLLKAYAYVFGGEHSDCNMYGHCCRFLTKEYSESSPKDHVESREYTLVESQIGDNVPEKEILTVTEQMNLINEANTTSHPTDHVEKVCVEPPDSYIIAKGISANDKEMSNDDLNLSETRVESEDRGANKIDKGDLRERLNHSKNKEQKTIRVSYVKIDSIKIYESTLKKFYRLTCKDIREMVYQELQELDGLRHIDTAVYKKKLEEIERLKRLKVKTDTIENNIYLLFKQINMFLFGVHQLSRGQECLELLKLFVNQSEPWIKYRNRGILLEAFAYIFGGEHPGHHCYAYYFNSLSAVNASSRPASNVPCEELSVPAITFRVEELQNNAGNTGFSNRPFTDTNQLEDSSIEDRAHQMSLQSAKGSCREEDPSDDLNCPALTLSMTINHRTQDCSSKNTERFNYLISKWKRNVPTWRNSTTNLDKSIIKKFHTSSSIALKKMIGQDVELLNTIPINKNYYVRKLDNIDKLSKSRNITESIIKELYFLHRSINMFLFGVCRLQDGKKHLENLRLFAHNFASKVCRRKKLIKDYAYIFGGKRKDVNYRKCLNNIT